MDDCEVPQNHQNILPSVRLHSAVTHSMLPVGIVGGLLIAVIVSLIIFVLLRQRRIKRKRTVRRLLQEKEVGVY